MAVVPLRRDGVVPQPSALERPTVIPPEDLELTAQMVAGYKSYGEASRNHSPGYTVSVERVVGLFMAFSRLPPWRWTVETYLQWMTHLDDAGNKRNTRRSYQGRLVSFLTYISGNETYCVTVKRRYGIELKQFITKQHRITHKLLDFAPRRRSISAEEVGKLSSSMIDRSEILRASNERSRYILALRDVAMVRCLWCLGSRASGLLSMTTDGFSRNPDLPALGKYGLVHTLEKGTGGSGRRPHIVPIDDLELPAVLHWYETEVRPLLLSPDVPNTRSFWLNQNGTPMEYGAFWRRLTKHLDEAGMGDLGISAHSFRRASVTESCDKYGPHVAAKLHNHAHLNSAGPYLQFGPSYVRDKIKKSVLQASSPSSQQPSDGSSSEAAK